MNDNTKGFNNSLKLRQSGGREVYMKEDSIYDKFLCSMNSGLEFRLALSILRDVDKNGVLRVALGSYVTKYDTSRKTIAKVINIAKDLQVILKVGKRIYVNPYVILPYNIKDSVANKLQQPWDRLVRLEASGKLTLVNALLIHEELFCSEQFGSLS